MSTNSQPRTKNSYGLGSAAYQFGTVYASNMSVSGVNSSGQLISTYVPTSNTVSTGSLYINPTTATSGYTLAGFAVGGTEKLRVTANGSLISGSDGSADLGSSDIRWNNLYVNTLTASGTNYNGQATFTYAPTSNAIGQGSIWINPTTATSAYPLLSLSIGGTEKARITTDGYLGLAGANDPGSSYILSAGSIFNIGTGGNVGIGVSIPGSKLSVIGNVGIGTSASGAALQVNGGGLFGWGTASSALSSGAILGVNGNVGVGTTSPLGALHVVGQCVAKGTRIRRRRRSSLRGDGDDEAIFNGDGRSPRFARDDDYIYEDIPVEDIKPDDEVLSLNDKTGEWEWNKVEKTMDMGIQEVYKIYTRSGLSIETTGNHPYLVKMKADKPETIILGGTFEVDQSPKMEDMTQDSFIAIASDSQKYILKLSKTLKKKLLASYKSKQLKNFAPILFGKSIVALLDLAGLTPGRLIIDQDYPGYSKIVEQEIKLTLPKLQIEFLSVGKDSPAHIAAFSFVSKKAKHKKTAVIPFKGTIALLHPEFHRDRQNAYGLFSPLYHKKDNLSTQWIKVNYLKPGMIIATARGWEPITAKYKTGRKQTYDLQIANTHNFLANNIVAHNTYINGSLGLGTAFTGVTTPTNGLAVSGNVGIGTTTANSALSVIGAGAFADGTAALPALTFNSDTDSGLWRIGTNQIALTTNGSGSLQSGTTINGLSVNANGNIGIGTTSSQAVLDVNGTAILRGSAGGNGLTVTGAGFVGIGITNPFGILQAGTNSTSPGLIVTSGGNVGIGLTNPTAYFQVNGNALFTNALTSGTAGTGLQINTGDPNTKGLIIKGNTYTPSGVQPNTISGLQLWLKADAITGLNDGDAVTTWTDSSTNGYDVTQSTVANKPTYKTSIVNGQPVVRFDGNNDTLTRSLFYNGTVFTIIAVTVPRATNNQRAVVSNGHSGVNGYALWTGDTAGTGHYSFGTYGVGAGEDGSIVTGVSHIWTIARSSTVGSNAIYIDGASQTNSRPNDVPNAPTTTFSVGSMEGSYPAQFDIAEVVFYNSALSSIDRQNVESYLANKYGITYTSTNVSQASNLQEWQNSSGTVLSAMDANGNLGIGTSGTAGSKLQLNGSEVIWGSFSSLVGPANGLAVQGNVGVGTTSPLGSLHVVGQCVAKGTRIRRRRKKKGSLDVGDEKWDLDNLNSRNQDNQDISLQDQEYLTSNFKGSEYIYEDVPVEDIKPDDEVLSLNDKTGEWEWNKVEKTMDMGIQEVFRLETEGGKWIETTKEHPYLVRDFESYEKQQDDNQNQTISNANFDINIFNIKFSFTGSLHNTLLNRYANIKDIIASNIFNGNTHRLSLALLEANKVINPAANQPADKFTNHSETIADQTESISSSISQAKWLKVFQIKPGMVIATTNGWEKIKTIYSTGRKQTYDLQIANTHNFVGGHYINRKTGKVLTSEQEAAYSEYLAQKTHQKTVLADGFSVPVDGKPANVCHTVLKEIYHKTSKLSNKNLRGPDGIRTRTDCVTNSGSTISLPAQVTEASLLSDILGMDVNEDDIIFGGIVAHNTYINGSLGLGTNFTGVTTPTNGLAVSGNVGIGTTTATNSLTLIGNESIGAGYGGYLAPTNGLLVQGNLGIGTSNGTGAFNLDVSGTGRFSSTLSLTSLTSGGALFAGTGGAISQQPSQFYWDDTNTRLGIGTSAPSTGFHVKSSGSGTSLNTLISSGGGLFGILDNGNVGIGITNPQDKLHINAAGGGGFTLNTPGTAKARAFTLPGVSDWFGFAVNSKYNGSTWDMDTTGENGAFFKVDTRNSQYGDAIAFYSIPKTGSTPIADSALRSVLTSRLADGYTSIGWIDIVNNPKYLAQLSVVPKSSTDKGIVIQGASNQSANLQEWQNSSGNILALVNASGNVGVGTSAAGAALQVNGGGLFGWGTASSALSSGAILGVNGNVGVGTTSPLGSLHVVGQCVSWDTRIRIRRRRRKLDVGGEKLDDEVRSWMLEYEWVEMEVMIKDIIPGDEVLSLNETTQEFEYQKVEKLLDMGTKVVYELTTKSGKTIKTTGNHPYLVKFQAPNSKLQILYNSPIKDAGWIKVTNLKVGDQIAVLGSVFGRSSSRSNLNQGESNNKKSEKHQSQNVHIPESKVHDSFLLNLYAQYRDTIPATTSNVNTMTFNEVSIPGNAGPKVATPNQNIDMLMAKSATTEINTTFPLFIKDHSITTFSTFQWDEIVGIKYMGYEHVFDLQISNTHNFVGNNIVAHNTYINGSLGLGTNFTGATTPTNGLAVSGNLGIGTTTANSKLTVIGGATIGSDYGQYTAPTNGLLIQGNVGIGTSVSSNPLTVGTDGTNGNGAYLSAGGAWQNGSSFEFKENFTELNSLDILSKINSLNLTQWNYKLEGCHPEGGTTEGSLANASISETSSEIPRFTRNDKEDSGNDKEDSGNDKGKIATGSSTLRNDNCGAPKHIGPIAEEFYSIFGLGNDNKHISTIDPAGVALVGIQGLSQEISNLKFEILNLKLNYGMASTSSASISSSVATPSATPGVDLTDQIASLSARIKDLESKGKSFLSSLIEFLGNVIFHGDVSFLGRPYFNKDTAGTAIIKKDADSVEVKFDKEYTSKPLVNVTITLDNTCHFDDMDPRVKPEDDKGCEASQSALERQVLDGDVKYIVTKRSTKGFTIKINKPASLDLTFSWSALAVKDTKTFTSEVVLGVQTASPSASPSISPTPTPVASASASLKSITIKINDNELGFLRVREEASTVSPEVGQVSPGQMFTVLVEKNGWYEIEYKPDFYGWVSGSYVQVQ